MSSKKQSKQKAHLRPKEGPEAFKDRIIGKPIDFISTSKLPLKHVILQRARGLRSQSTANKELGLSSRDMSDKEIAKIIATELLQIWERAAIPCIRIDKIQGLVLKSLQELSSVMKNWSLYEDGKECYSAFNSFVTSLDKLFDISPSDMYHKLQASGNPDWKEDWEFFQGQCQFPQIGSMSGRDGFLEERQKRSDKRKSLFQARVNKHANAEPLPPTESKPSTAPRKTKQDVLPERSGYALRRPREITYPESE